MKSSILSSATEPSTARWIVKSMISSDSESNEHVSLLNATQTTIYERVNDRSVISVGFRRDDFKVLFTVRSGFMDKNVVR